ncbi:MAG TPA: serine hydrolase domain-containing protein [Steroidobacteraceae bacterium]|jgi:CubicO group peptidase (beta-lactamase class C family)|nr:serine hydrolase domain-containing protein [Steroidobacteraceae bacterium]
MIRKCHLHAAESGRTRMRATASKVRAGAIALAVGLLPGLASAEPVDQVRRVISDGRGISAPGCALGVFRDGQTLFFQSSGAANVATARPLNENTLFYAASVSKQFTALAIIKLVELGKLDLIDDVHKWIPELPAYERPITVQMLMHHTAGIRDWIGLLTLAGVRDYGKIDRHTALDLLYKQKNTNFAPGSRFEYTNGAYLLLSEIVQRVSGMPFHEFAHQALFAPLGMTHTYFIHGSRPTGDNTAHGYAPVGDGFEVYDVYPVISGSGGLITTLADFAKYDHDVQVGHKVWTPAAAKIMLTPGTLSDGSKITSGAPYHVNVGTGLFVGLVEGRYLFGHSGEAGGFSTYYGNLPDRHLGIAVVCNRSDIEAMEKGWAVIDILEKTSLSGDQPGQVKQAPRTGTREEPSFIARPDLSGAYISDELQASYRVTVVNGVSVATISSPWADPGSAVASLRLTVKKGGSPKDGPYQFVDGNGGAHELALDGDGKGFRVSSGLGSGPHFKRTEDR